MFSSFSRSFSFGRRKPQVALPYSVPSAVTDGLMLFWDPGISDGFTLTDQSGNGRNATLFNSPSITPGTNGVAGYVTLNGTNQYFSSPNLYNGVSDHTVEIWVRPTATNRNFYSDADRQNNIDGYHSAGGQIYAGPVTNNTVITGLWNGTAVSRVVNGAKANWLNNWWQIVRTYSGTTLTPYTNGATTDTGGPATISWDPPWGGTRPDLWYLNFGASEGTAYTGTTAGWFSGRYGIVRVYNRALSASEVLSNYNNTRALYGL